MTTLLSPRQALAVIAASAAMVAGMAGCSQAKSADSLIQEAREYRQKGDSKAAVIQLKNALREQANNAEARVMLAEIFNASGDPYSAEKEYRKAADLGIGMERLMPGLGKAMLGLGQYQRVLEESAPLAQQDPDVASLRGHAYLAAGKPEEAKAAFARVLQSAPGHADALLGSARAALASGKGSAQAAEWVDQALRSNPQHAEAWQLQGDLLRAQGQGDAALAAYRKAAAANPLSAPAQVMIAYVHIDAGRHQDAQDAIAAARRANAGYLGIHHAQGLLEFSKGNLRAALESVQHVLRGAPDHMPAVLLAGAVQSGLGNTRQAEQHLKEYLEKEPGHLYAVKLLASVMLKGGRFDEALSLLAPALRKAPEDIHLLSLTGEAHMQSRNFLKATEYFEKAAALAPGLAVLHTALGVSRLEQGNDAAGMRELEKAVKLDDNAHYPSMLLALTQTRLKEFDRALETVAAMERRTPDNPLVHNLRGGVHLAQDRPGDARESFQKALSLEPGYMPAASNLARMDLMQNKPQDARQRFESVLKKDSKNAKAMEALASLALSQGHPEEATKWLERSRTENPGAVPPALQLASHYWSQGQKDKALNIVQQLHATHPDNENVLALTGRFQLAAGNARTALESYSRLVSLVPNSPQARLGLANAHLALDNEAAASESLHKALSLKPDYLQAQLLLAQLEARRGKFEAAMARAKQLQQNEHRLAGYVLEGDLQLAQNKAPQALKAYEAAFAIDKSTAMIIKIHETLARIREKDADARLRQWMDEHPRDLAARLYLGSVHLGKKDGKAAAAAFEEVLRQDEKNVAALNNVALAYQLDNDERALAAAEKAHRLLPDNAAVLDTLGFILVERGAADRGVPLLTKAASLAPQSPEIRYHLALGLMKAGDKRKAREELERLLAMKRPFSASSEAESLLQQLKKTGDRQAASSTR